MILSDILRFVLVYVVFLFGFSAGMSPSCIHKESRFNIIATVNSDLVMYCVCNLPDVFTPAVVTLLIEPPPKNVTRGRFFFPVNPEEDCFKPSYRNISYTTMQLFKFTIGMGDMEFTENYKYKEVFYLLLISYIILTYILLLNMLIALMNRTVEKTTEESTSIWGLQVRRPVAGELFVDWGGCSRSSCNEALVNVLFVCLFFLQRAITILDMERRLPCCLRSALRCGVRRRLGTTLGDDWRWCFRLAFYTHQQQYSRRNMLLHYCL